MQNKIQELTEKIYQEGIEKGNAEARQIVEEARKDASEIVKNAQKEADDIIAAAKKKADEYRNTTETELRLSSKQAVNAVKQQITDVVNGQIATIALKGTFEDNEFIKKIVEKMLGNWAASGQSMDMNVLLPAGDEKQLSDYFKKSAKSLLDQGIEIKFDASVKAGFQLSPKDGSYKVSFTDSDFINFFKQFLRPKLVEILFSAE